MTSPKSCVFCQIREGALRAAVVYEDEDCLAFLDHVPLFPGHTLLVPKQHFVTLDQLPAPLASHLMLQAQRLCRAVQAAMGAQGTFVAVNNRISQSVPHLHIHVVPRRKGDGLRGFFWPRQKYTGFEQMGEVAAQIAAALKAVDIGS